MTPVGAWNEIIKLMKVAVLLGALLLAGALWWMLGTPGSAKVEPLPPLNAEQSELAQQLRNDIHLLSVDIGERNIPSHPAQLARAATFIDRSLESAGYVPQSQWYTVAGSQCGNIIAEVPETNPMPTS